MQWPRLTTVLTLLGLAACADAAQTWRGTQRDSAGVTIVENPAQPILGDIIEGREVLRIGSAAGAAETQFGLIASIAVSEGGELYVLDQMARRVRVFDAQGGFLREMGGSGGGPGELSDFAVAVMLFADSVFVADPGNRRFNVYSPDGTAAREIPMPFPTGTLPQRFAMQPDGRILEMARTMATPRNPELRDDVILVIERDGSVGDTLYSMPTSRTIRFRGGVVQFSAYDAEPVWAVDSAGLLFTGMSGNYRVDVRDMEGRLQRVVTRTHIPQPVTEADKRAFLRLVRQTMTEQGVDPALIEQMLNGMSFAESYPVFAHFLPGPGGTLWVQRIRTAADAARDGNEFDAAQVGSDRWDVFDADGRYFATARLPFRFIPLTHAHGRFYGTWKNELDLDHVLVVEVDLPGTPD